MPYIEEYCKNYLEKIFYFGLRKTGNEADADELASNISFEILSALNRGTVPKSFEAWVWTIARNQYARWAKNRYYSPLSDTVDIAECEFLADDAPILEEKIIFSEELALIRRELAFIRADYRNILLAHYFEEKSVSMIAREFHIPVGTVKTKLISGRKQLKEGMNMAREFGKRSYKPEQISFIMNGRDGKLGQPWSITKHLLYKNVFLEAYENPRTAEELSLELGIALPYMEDELEYLVREELLRKRGNKYETNFPIISREEQRIKYEANKKVQKPLTDKLCEMIDLYMKEDGVKVDTRYIGYETAKWALLARCTDRMFCDTPTHEWNHEITYPLRPNNGKWILEGYESIDWEEPFFVGAHGYLAWDEPDIKKDIEFTQYKFYIQNHQKRTPEHLTYAEAYNLWLVCEGKEESAEKGYLEKLLEYGYLKKENDTVIPNILIFNRKAEKSYNAELTARLTALHNEICALIGQAPSISRGYVIEQALADGWLKYDENTSPVIGAYIYI